MENSDNLYKVLDEINSSLHPMYELTENMRKGLFAFVISMSKTDNPEEAKKLKDEIVFEYEKEGYNQLELPEVAYYAVYGYQQLEEWCGESCCITNGISMHSVLKQSDFKADIQLKCYECNQLQFINVLSSLVRGDYEKLNKLYRELLDSRKDSLKINRTYHHNNAIYLRNNLLNRAYKSIMPKLNISDTGELEKSYILTDVGLIGSHYDIESRFNSYLNSLLGFSLSEFIINKDLRKLKLCQRCNIFFIAKKKDKRIKYCPTCSKKNKMTKEDRREYQKKYYWNKKHQKLENDRELTIQKHMENLGCTREEAEAMYVTDQEL
jgi:hypothetical protein